MELIKHPNFRKKKYVELGVRDQKPTAFPKGPTLIFDLTKAKALYLSILGVGM